MSDDRQVAQLYDSIDYDREQEVRDGEAAYLVIHENEVLGSHLVPGLEVEPKPLADGIEVNIRVLKGQVIDKPVHMCFGVLPEDGLQRIVIHADIEEGAKVSVLAHCTFPNAVNIRHVMDADIKVGRGAEYSYFERHVHGPSGGVTVVPKAKVTLEEGARFKTEFELIKGRVGEIDIEYETTCHADSVMEMTARISGSEDDVIKINEIGHLVGEGARGVLNTYIAVKDKASASVHNTLTAHAAGARGHVDCKEIVQGDAVAMAVPIVDVRHPKAHITHEAAIGSVDAKQLETLMSRGLSEEEASDLIIEGLLS